jgi:hypothetical protein
MKKVLFLLLVTSISYGQALFDKGVKITGGITTDNTATKLVVQSANNVLSTILKDNLIDVVIVNTTAELTAGIGNISKLYATRDNTIIYRFNGTIYIPLVDPLTNASGLLEFNTTDRTVWSNGKGNITSNTVFGDSSLKSITTGGFNTAIGTNVLSNITTGNGNIGIGTDAGSPGNINSDSSIFIGVDARPAGSDQTNQIVIGAGGRGAGSNTVTLGNSSITSTTLFGAVNAGSFIKNSATSTNLLLAGGSDITQASLPVSTATQTALDLKQNTISGTVNVIPKFGTGGVVASQLFDNGTSIGIGTISPGMKLDVVGSGRFSTNLDVGLSTSNNGARININGGSVASSNFLIGNNINVANGFEITPSTLLGGSVFSTPVAVFRSSGNIGFGTNNPLAKLVVSSGEVLINQTANNAIDKLQVNGTVSFSPATLLNQGITKAQTLYTNQTITANKTVTIAEFVNNNELVLRVSAAAGNITVTLPTFTALQGYKVTVRKIDSSANSVTITGVGAINIDGAATLVVSGQYGKATIGADLVQYIIL